MDTPLSLTHERVDDIPLILTVAKRMGLPAVLDEHLGRHGNHQGLSSGWLATVWMAYILSEGDHRKSAVEEWARRRAVTLQRLLGHQLRDSEFTDDRLGNLLRRMSDGETWQAIEQALWRQTAFVYDLDVTGVRLDSTTSYGYHTVSDGGLMQWGHSKDHRPDLPQLKLMSAVAEPTEQMLAADVVPGHRADDELYVPLIERVREMLDRRGMLYIGDAKMSARKTRGAIVAGQDYYLTPLIGHRHEQAQREAWLAPVLDGSEPARLVWRDDQLQGAGYEIEREQSAKVDGRTVRWTERVLLFRSAPLAKRQSRDLDQRLAKAREALLALSPPPSRGRQQLWSSDAMAEAIARTKRRFKVAGLLWVKWRREAHPSRDDPDRVRYVIVDVIERRERIAAQRDRLGWRFLATNLPAEHVSLPAAVRTYHRGWLIERQFYDLKDRPLGIRPLFVTRDDQIIGLTHLLTLALRVLTLITSRVRQSLAARGETLHGLFEGQPSRQTDRPTGRRLLGAFYRAEITLTRIRGPDGTRWHVSPLSELHQTILRHLDLSDTIYTELAPTAA